MHFLPFEYLASWGPLLYLAAGVAMIIEGDVFLFIVAFLTHRGLFHLGLIVPTVFAGALLGDSLWYALGWRLARSTGRPKHWVERATRLLDTQLIRRPFKTIFVTKFTYGLHHAVLMRAGAGAADGHDNHLPFRRFLRLDIPAAVIWILIVGGAGFLFSASFLAARRYLRFTEIGLLLGLLVFLNLERLVGHWSERRLERSSADS